MFKIVDKSVRKKWLSTIAVFDNVNIENFLENKAPSNEIVLCPVHAINVEEKKILQEKCISCGICWINLPEYIDFGSFYDKRSFLKYCKKDKLFVYRWLSLILSDYSGTNVKSKGFSRTKRIPLIVLDHQIVYLFKAARSVKDVEEIYYDLEDTVELSEELKNFKVSKVIIIMDYQKEDKKYLTNFPNTIFLSLEKILDNLLTNKLRKFKDYLELSRC